MAPLCASPSCAPPRSCSAELRTWAAAGRHALEVVELPRGQKPLRRTVGKDVEQGVRPINETCAQVQHHLLTAFNLR